MGGLYSLKRAKPDKSLGADEIPSRLLHAIGEPLVQALTALSTSAGQLNASQKGSAQPVRLSFANLANQTT